MDIRAICSLLGGVGLFLYGMRMMSMNLEDAAGPRLKHIMERLTKNPVRGVLWGTVITAVLQSSSAVTVMAVGFVDSGIMTLNQAVWLIMGANIGTTITGQLIALDITSMAPLAAFLGIILLFFKDRRINIAGGVLAGLGVMFIGLSMVENAVLPLRDAPAIIGLMTRCGNPLWGILAGTVFTAVIQSSSASVGILQALANSGLIGLNGAVYVVFGQNIGTCITAMIAAFSADISGKRTALIHLLINLAGTGAFVLLCAVVPFSDWIGQWTPGNPAAQIANVHTVFNIGSTLLLLPFSNKLIGMSMHLISRREKKQTQM